MPAHSNATPGVGKACVGWPSRPSSTPDARGVGGMRHGCSVPSAPNEPSSPPGTRPCEAVASPPHRRRPAPQLARPTVPRRLCQPLGSHHRPVPVRAARHHLRRPRLADPDPCQRQLRRQRHGGRPARPALPSATRRQRRVDTLVPSFRSPADLGPFAAPATFWLLLLYLGSRSTPRSDTIEAAAHRAGGLLPRQRRLESFDQVCRPVRS